MSIGLAEIPRAAKKAPSWHFLLDVQQRAMEGASCEVDGDYAPIQAAFRKRQRNFYQRLEQLYRSANSIQDNKKKNVICRSHKAYEEFLHVLAAASGDRPMNKTADGAPVPYIEQGDMSLYTTANLLRRERNRYDPKVKKAIDQFWSVLPKLESGSINKSVYKWYMRKLFFHLVPIATEEHFQRIVEEDWKNDAVWSNTMSDRMFRNAIFSLADIWCETCEADEYCSFIAKCARVVSLPPHYAGTLDEVGEIETAMRLTSFFASTIEFVEPEFGVDGVEPIVESEEHLAAMENIETALFDVDGDMWVDILSLLEEIEVQEADDDYNDLHASIREIQGARFDVFRNTSDAAFELEGTLNTTGRSRLAEQGMRQNLINHTIEQLKIDHFAGAASIVERVGKRRVLQRKREHEQDWFWGVICDAERNSALIGRQVRNSLCGLKKELLNHYVTQETDDVEALMILGVQLGNEDRKLKVASFSLEAVFKHFISMAKDLHDFKSLRQRRMRHTLGEAIHPPGDHGPFKFSNEKWAAAINWLQAMRARRGQMMDDALHELLSLINKLESEGMQNYVEAQRLIMSMESKIVAFIKSDELLTHKHKVELLSQTEQSKRARLKQSANRMELFQGKMKQLHQKYDELTVLLEKKSQAESAEEKGWLLAKTASQAFEQSKGVLELMSEVFEKGKDVEALKQMGLDAKDFVELPENVISASDFLTFILRKTEEWHFMLLDRFAQFRIDICDEWLTWGALLDSETDHRIEQFKVQMCQRRVLLAKEFRATIAAVTSTSSYDVPSVEAMKARIAKYEKFLAVNSTTEAALRSMRADSGRIETIGEQRREERREKVRRLYETLRVHYFRAVEFDTLKFRKQEALHQAARLAANVGEQVHEPVVIDLPKISVAKIQELAVKRTQYTFPASNLSGNANKKMATGKKIFERMEAAALEKKLKDKERREKALAFKVKEAEEKARKQLEFVRKAEQERNEIEKKQKMEAKQREEVRRRHLAEREEKQAKRLADERKKGEEVHDELQRQATTQFSEEKELLAQFAESEQIGPAPPSPKSARSEAKSSHSSDCRQISIYFADALVSEETKQAVATAKRRASFSAKLREAINEEIKSFRILDSTSLLVDAEDFAARRREYLLEKMSNADIYYAECKRLGAAPQSQIFLSLLREPLVFQQAILDASNVAKVETLYDLVRLNPIQKLTCSKLHLNKDQVRQLCQIAYDHQFLQYLDVSGNLDVGPHGGQSLLGLVEHNPRITTVVATSCSIPLVDAEQIRQQCNRNAFCRDITCSDFRIIKSVFDSVDTDKRAEITLGGLQHFVGRSANSLVSSVTSRAFSSTLFELNVKKDVSTSCVFRHLQLALLQRRDEIRNTIVNLHVNDEECCGITFDELITLVFPTRTAASVTQLIREYQDESVPSVTTEMLANFLVSYGTEGTLTVEQLAKGLRITDPKDVEALVLPLFLEADLDNDGYLDPDELARLVYF